MTYHLVLTDAQGHAVDVRTSANRADAERAIRLVLSGNPSWSPTRYPGRTWRRGEVDVYIDRRTAVLRELSVLRCSADHQRPDLGCVLRHLAIPALNLHTRTPTFDHLAPQETAQPSATRQR